MPPQDRGLVIREPLFYISVMGFLAARMVQVIDDLKICSPPLITVLTVIVLGIYFGSNFWIISKCTAVPPPPETDEDWADQPVLTTENWIEDRDDQLTRPAVKVLETGAAEDREDQPSPPL